MYGFSAMMTLSKGFYYEDHMPYQPFASSNSKQENHTDEQGGANERGDPQQDFKSNDLLRFIFLI